MDQTILDEVNGQAGQEDFLAPPPPMPEATIPGGILNTLLKKSPNKAIEEYENHPLNYDKKQSTGRILRGLEGLFMDLNYAVVDVLLGVIEKWKEGRKHDTV
ncbi:MAG: hypothetical protein BWY70_01670 [Bacteroidetes bacterium ADurb.Bin408]|nr:MAG: hypothetical protein BWY70_01670 [Bacteroidetes bacterium ADurb.Bin408]